MQILNLFFQNYFVNYSYLLLFLFPNYLELLIYNLKTLHLIYVLLFYNFPPMYCGRRLSAPSRAHAHPNEYSIPKLQRFVKPLPRESIYFYARNRRLSFPIFIINPFLTNFNALHKKTLQKNKFLQSFLNSI